MFTLLPFVALLATQVFALPSAQIPFLPKNSGQESSVQASFAEEDQFTTTFKHDHFPSHQIRAIRPKKGFCDPTVEQWSGYLDTPNDRHFYFWFFESRSDPVNDPVVLWLNGGPGCSSFTGLLMELGPCRVTQPDKNGHVGTDPNPWSWNSNASIIFLDQPIGVGYSYADKGDKGVWSTPAAAQDVHALLQIWFNAFDKDFGSNDFHIAGESFAGRYIPVFSDYIVQQNKLDNGLRKINLRTIMVGNGMTHPYVQYSYYQPVVCTNITSYGPYLDSDTCSLMATGLTKCQQLMRRCAENTNDSITCLSASTYCERTQTQPFYDTGRNAYDMEKFGEYDEEAWMAMFLNQESTMKTLGVTKASHGRIKKHTGCDPTVGYRFSATGDGAKPSYPYVKNVLEAGVSALFYSGDRDFICNAAGNQAWLNDLDWSGRQGFQSTVLAPWYGNHDKPKALSGQFRSFGNLTFATVAQSGHFVPYDKPQDSLAMANAWLHQGSGAFSDFLSKPRTHP